MALIRLENIRRVFRRGDQEIAALNGINLEIQDGDFTAITGKSGSGKSTLLYILGLLDSPSSGSYQLDGRESATISDDERAKLRSLKIGFIFQSFHLLPRVSALRNVAMPLVYANCHGLAIKPAEQLRRARQCLDKVGLTERAEHLPNQLSGGQCQRVAIARAVVNSPRLLLADEPTGNLDTKTGRDVLKLLQELNTSGVTILLVTHDKEIASFARKQVFMKDGAIDAVV